MPDVHEIALSALKKMREDRGADAVFPSDAVWMYLEADVPSSRRPGAITWLRRHGHIETTGAMTNAETAARAGSKTPQYRFAKDGSNQAREIWALCSAFEADCDGIL